MGSGREGSGKEEKTHEMQGPFWVWNQESEGSTVVSGRLWKEAWRASFFLPREVGRPDG